MVDSKVREGAYGQCWLSSFPGWATRTLRAEQPPMARSVGEAGLPTRYHRCSCLKLGWLTSWGLACGTQTAQRLVHVFPIGSFPIHRERGLHNTSRAEPHRADWPWRMLQWRYSRRSRSP